KDALDAFTQGAPIATTITAVTGKALQAFPAVESPTYVADVAPILAKNCVSCHSEGNIGPFTMDGYRQVKGWASMMKEVLLTKRMPPWHADPHYSSFAND